MWSIRSKNTCSTLRHLSQILETKTRLSVWSTRRVIVGAYLGGHAVFYTYKTSAANQNLCMSLSNGWSAIKATKLEVRIYIHVKDLNHKWKTLIIHAYLSIQIFSTCGTRTCSILMMVCNGNFCFQD